MSIEPEPELKQVESTVITSKRMDELMKESQRNKPIAESPFLEKISTKPDQPVESVEQIERKITLLSKIRCGCASFVKYIGRQV